VTAGALEGIDASWDSKHFAALFKSKGCSDQGPALHCGLHYDYSPADAADYPVATGKIPRFRGCARNKFAYHRTFFNELLVKLLIGFGVDEIDPGTQNGKWKAVLLH